MTRGISPLPAILRLNSFWSKIVPLQNYRFDSTPCIFLGLTIFFLPFPLSSQKKEIAKIPKIVKSSPWQTPLPRLVRRISSPPASRTPKLISRTSRHSPPYPLTSDLTIGLGQTQCVSSLCLGAVMIGWGRASSPLHLQFGVFGRCIQSRLKRYIVFFILCTRITSSR